MILGTIVVGLLALGIFLVAGGVFATVGPWVIFAGALVLAKRSERCRKVSHHAGKPSASAVGMRGVLS